MGKIEDLAKGDFRRAGGRVADALPVEEAVSLEGGTGDRDNGLRDFLAVLEVSGALARFRENLGAGERHQVKIFKEAGIDSALEWCEDRVFEVMWNMGADFSVKSSKLGWVHTVVSWFTRWRCGCDAAIGN